MQNTQNEQDDVPLGFNTIGCWVRVLRRPLEEIQNLAFRHDLYWDTLLGHDHIDTPGYTPYSCCTYLKEGLGISLFEGNPGDNFGIFIRPFKRRIDWFYDGRREIVTDGIKPIAGRRYDNGGGEESQLWDCSMEEIADLVMNLRNQYAQDSYYKNNPQETVTLKWNEGFLRHQTQDITGILINGDSKISVLKALAFRKALKLNVGLFTYDQQNGVCQRFGSAELCEIHGVHVDSQAFLGIKNMYETQFKSDLAAIRAVSVNANLILE